MKVTLQAKEKHPLPCSPCEICFALYQMPSTQAEQAAKLLFYYLFLSFFFFFLLLPCFGGP